MMQVIELRGRQAYGMQFTEESVGALNEWIGSYIGEQSFGWQGDGSGNTTRLLIPSAKIVASVGDWIIRDDNDAFHCLSSVEVESMYHIHERTGAKPT